MRPSSAFLLLACSIGLAGCAAHARLTLPSGDATAAPDAVTVLAAATARCREIRTLTTEIALSGRIEGRRARGRLLAGTEATGRLRLEALAPFGAPVFVLAATRDSATLLFPRDRRVVNGARVEDLLDALVGIRLTAADVHATLAGCGVPPGPVHEGRRYWGSWLAADVGDATVWMRELDTGPELRAARVGDLTVEYLPSRRVPPERLRIEARPAAATDVRASLTLRVSDVETNVPIDDRAFTVEVPPDARPMSLEELRAMGPLGEAS